MDFELFNSETRKTENFTPLDPPAVRFYTCGLTVYYYAHIGNLRAYVSSDLLRRALVYLGYDVKQVMNVTDVGHMTSDEDEGEDKIEMRSRKEKKSPWEIARYYEEYFFDSLNRMNIREPSVRCRATEHIDEMIELIKRLEQRGFTYQTSVGVIFDTSRFPKYADFAKLQLEAQTAGARVQVDPERKNPWDFALWVTNQPNHIMQWDSPWGRGFPGWHIECSAMSMKYLGEQLDIHSGGIDHLPVHHTNEIAQSEAATGKKFVKYWFHTQFLLVDGSKMSKSLGNLYTLEDLEKWGIAPLSLRYFFLTSSYRKQMNFTWDALQAAQTALIRLWQKCLELPEASGKPFPDIVDAFQKAICSDLNTAKGLAILWDMINSDKDPAGIVSTLYDMDRVLGLDLKNALQRLKEIESIQITSPENEKKAFELAQKRDMLRREKKFAEADALRDEIDELGFVVEDTKDGPRIKPKAPAGK